PSIPAAASRARGFSGVPKDSRSFWFHNELSTWGARPSATWQSVRNEGRHSQSKKRLSGFSYPLERRRSRHPHPERSQGGVREAAMTRPTIAFWQRESV